MAQKRRRVALMLDLDWPYKRHVDVFAGTQQYAQQRLWEPIIDEFVSDTLSPSDGKSAPYDGVIARATKKLAQQCQRLKVPVVNVWFNSPVRDVLPGVFADSAAIGRMQADHLLARGLRNFSALTTRGDRAYLRTSQEFGRVVNEAGFSCILGTVPYARTKSVENWRKTQRAIATWMDNWTLPIGVYVADDAVGRLVVQMCRQRGWRVPEDVALIAGANEERICEHPRPSLTSVEYGHQQIGYEAARLLDRLMDEVTKWRKRKAVSPECILIPPQGLVVRESTDFFAVDDQMVAAALRFISANSHKRIGVDVVARAVGASKRTLQVRFRRHLDRAVAAEIRRVRIERAKRELTQSDRTLSEIARDVGFRNSQRLCHVFRREVRVSPNEYRKQRKKI